nr:uncharacterized protein C5orf34 homolog isoform X3 [Pogona vitticeps]
MGSESFMILYEDNSVEVHYTDGSKLLLSPCGSEFLFEKAVPASAHPIQPPERVRQRTPFAISIYRDQILQAIDFRNVYSSRPYLPSRIIPTERKNVNFTDISEAKWPSHHNTEGMIFQNGTVTVSSLDNHARLFLPELQEEFIVQFLCKVSQTLPTPLPFSEESCDKSVQDCGDRSSKGSLLKLSSKQVRTEGEDNVPSKSGEVAKQDGKSSNVQKDETLAPFETCSSEYSWVTQQMPVSSCPEEWKYPLSLALMFHQSHSYATESDKSNKTSESIALGISECEESVAVTPLPSALPLSCQAPYLHRWNFSDFFQHKQEDEGHHLHSQPVKVLWSNGVIYRFSLGTKSVEIYPGDGSVFKSEGSFLGKYFSHCYIQEQTKQRQEMMYSVSNLPPDTPGSIYSVGAIITQALRVLLHDLENMLSLTHNYSICCWQMKSEEANTGWCKMMSPGGAQQLVQINSPGIYERYITIAVEWCRSLNNDAYTAAPQTVPEPEENWSVAAELEKIKRFNFLVENSNIPRTVTTVKRNPCFNTVKGNSPEEMHMPNLLGEKNIAETLEKTSKVISDIDSLLASCTKQNMVKSFSNNTLLH